jgi:maltooligosyltrehalose trehalohydrolase
MSLGAACLGDNRCQFRVWAPFAAKVEVHLLGPEERFISLDKDDRGYYGAVAESVARGSRYLYRLDGKIERPDPASRFQPQGVHGPSQVVASQFPWEDEGWHGLPLQKYIIYELHIGVFSPEGTFDAVIPYLDGLKGLGITALELMPVAQFPGERNWGYDGVYPFAVQDSYGGPEGLKRLVNACHQRELAIVLDVVYNHLGPEGNYIGDFGPYFTDRYHTPWGKALNFDGPDSDEVRRFFIENALYWVTEFHIDALRLDALHAILDISAYPFIEELSAEFHRQVKSLRRRAYLIGESAANDARLVSSPGRGGFGLDAQWNDDFHHALHALLTGEKNGYYRDFGQLNHLAKAFREGFVYSGEYSPFYRRRHGTSSRDIPAHRLVAFAQNHDQVGNRARGERLSQLVSFEGLKLAAGAVLLSPFIPLIFMGEEYAEAAPFLYFISHSDLALVEAVRKGRQQEFAAFGWRGELADPQAEATFERSRLNHRQREGGQHRLISDFYRELIRLRWQIPALAQLSKDNLEVLGYEEDRLLFVRRWRGDSQVAMVFNFSEGRLSATLPLPGGRWLRLLDSADERWRGEGSAVPDHLDSGGEVSLTLAPSSFIVLSREV